MRSSNPTVVNAIAALNMPWGGNLYKCPHCGTMQKFSQQGECGKCGLKLKGVELGKFLSERIKRELRKGSPHEIRGIGKHKITGEIDIPTATQRHLAKHPGAIQQLGMTLGAGKYGHTTVGSRPGMPKDPNRVSIVHKSNVAFTKKDGNRSKSTTHFASGSVAAREQKLHKETRRK